MEQKWKKVEEDEFKTFIEAWPKYSLPRLEKNINCIGEPPRSEYHDFSGGKMSPESIVAYIMLYSDSYDPTKPNEYYIREGIHEGVD